MSIKIGHIGLGALGTPIAINLARYAATDSPAPLVIFNRSKDKYATIKAEVPDIFEAEDLGEVVKRCDVIFTCLLNDAVAVEIYETMIAAAKEKEGKVVFIDITTLGPKTSARLAAEAKGAGCTYLSSPVFGQPAAAKAKALVCILAGPAEEKEKVKLLLEAIGRKTVDVGEDVTKASTVKLLGNMVILNSIQVYSEAYALSDAIGFDPNIFHEVFQTVFPAPPLINYSNKISKGTFGLPGFAMDVGLKDAGLMMSLADGLDHPVPLPTLDRAVENIKRAKQIGGAEYDWSALAIGPRIDAGLEPFREGTDKGKKLP